MRGEVMEYVSLCLKTAFLDLWESRNKNKWKSSHFKANLKSCQKNERCHMSLETLPTSNRHPKLSDEQEYSVFVLENSKYQL